MMRKCPACHRPNVRKSRVASSDSGLRRFFLSPYRCRNCRVRFWVISRSIYRAAAAILVIALLAVLTRNTGWDRPNTPALSAEQSAEVSAETIRRANSNEPSAEYELAQWYSTGMGARDTHEARKWLVRAAKHGSAPAQYAYGFALLTGDAELQDLAEATKWIMESAKAGHAPAQLELGLMYRSGTGVAQDDAKAYTWLNLAAAASVIGAASARDSVLHRLSPTQIERAQAEARDYLQAHLSRPQKATDDAPRAY